MNKLLKFAGVTSLALFLLTGCGGSKKQPAPAAPAPAADFGCKYKGKPAPEWYCEPYVEGAAVAVGEAAPNRGGDRNMQRTTAVAKARSALAMDLEVKVKAMVTDWTRVTGAGEAQTYESNAEQVSKQVSAQTLQGSRMMKSWEAPDGTLIVLVGVQEAAVKDGITTSLKNDQALWQQFQSQKAQEALDAEFDKQFGN